jgi:phosphonate metabolism protein (transferase hexapeptide repeat family)
MTEDPKRHGPTARRAATPFVHGSANLRNARLGRFSEIKERVQFWDSELGDYSYVERQSEVIYSVIGRFCAIASDVRLNALSHPIERVSQHKVTYRPNEYFAHAKLDKAFRDGRAAQRVTIGHDVWVGHGAIVMPGVSIGHGAVIAAGAVVTRDVPPYAIVAGVPARFLKWRFAPDIAHRIVSLAWWDWDDAKLAAAVPDMQVLGIVAFLEKYGG